MLGALWVMKYDIPVTQGLCSTDSGQSHGQDHAAPPAPGPRHPRHLALQADMCELPSPVFSGAAVPVTRAMLCAHHTRVWDAGQSCSGFGLNAPCRLVQWALRFAFLAKGHVSGVCSGRSGHRGNKVSVNRKFRELADKYTGAYNSVCFYICLQFSI